MTARNGILALVLLIMAALPAVAQNQKTPPGQAAKNKVPPKENTFEEQQQKEVYKGQRYLDQAFAMTNARGGLGADDFTAIIDLCRKGLETGVKKESADYASKLMAWAHNRRGENFTAGAAPLGIDKIKQKTELENKALADFESAIQLDDSLWKAYHNRGISYAQMGKTKEAIADFNRTIELKSAFPNAYFNRGQIRYQLGEHQAAIEDYNEALRLNPRDPEAYNCRGHARYRLGQYREALADYDQAVKLDPRNVTAYTNRADAYADQGFWEQAAADYRKATELGPKFARALQGAAWLMATCPDERFRNRDRALSAAQKAVELEGRGDYRYLDTLAAAFANAGRFDDAKSIMKEVIDKAPEAEQKNLKARLAIYEEGKPYRESARDTTATRPRPRQ